MDTIVVLLIVVDRIDRRPRSSVLRTGKPVAVVERITRGTGFLWCSVSIWDRRAISAPVVIKT